MILFLVIFSVFSTTQCIKVPNLNGHPCRFAAFDSGSYESLGLLPLAAELGSLFTDPFEAVNCTFENIISTVSTDQQIGLLEKNRYNGSVLALLLATVSDKPVHVSGIASPSDLSIYVVQRDHQTTDQDVTHITKNFSPVLYEYIIIIIFSHFILLFIAFVLAHEFWISRLIGGKQLLFRRRRRKLNRFSMRRFLKFMRSVIWKTPMAFFGKESLASPTPSTSILLASLLISSFILINGYYLNLISCDMTALVKPRVIDTLDELLNDPEFAHLNVHTPGGLWQEQTLRTASRGSDEQLLWQKIQSTGGTFTIELDDLSKLKQLIDQFDNLIDFKLSFVADSIAHDGIKRLLCQFVHRLKEIDIHKSSESFGKGLIVMTTSIHNQENFQKFIDYRYQSVLESGVVLHFLNDIVLKETSHDPTFTSGQAVKCLADKPSQLDQKVPIPFNLNFFKPIFQIMWFMLHKSLIILAIEIVIFWYYVWRMNRNNVS